MARATLLTDDLVHRLIAVGQVDVVVGLPTMNNAETIAGALQAVHEGLSQHFARARTVVIAADGGSRDGTPDIIGALPSGARDRYGGLRTRHQIVAAYRGVPGRAGAIRLIFTAADLLQARAVAVLDPDTDPLTPASIGGLLTPAGPDSFDLVAPVRARHPLERLLVTQLIRPLVRAAYGRQLDEPLLTEFACSGRFAAHCLAEDVWDRSPMREGIELWLAATALSGFKACQTCVETAAAAPSQRPRPGLQEVFTPLVGSLFAALDAHAGAWQRDTAPEPVPVIGVEVPPPADAPAGAPSGLGGSFAQDVRDLRPVLESILAPETFAAVAAIAEAAGAEGPSYPDESWVATVYDFAAGYHAGAIDRAHIVQALMPLYVGRVASFVTGHAASPADEVARDLETLAQQFERSKPYLIERWYRAS